MSEVETIREMDEKIYPRTTKKKKILVTKTYRCEPIIFVRALKSSWSCLEAVGPGPIFIFTLLAAALASLASIEIPFSQG